MLLFTSNFKNFRSHWLFVWLIVISICSLSLISYEIFLKNKGFLASVESNKDIWSWYRSNVYSDKTIVLLGASRSLLGLNLPTIKKILPNYQVQQLSLNGKYPIGTLISLANDPNFHGNVLISIKSEALNKALFEMQKEWYDYYQKGSSLYKSFDAFITAFIQSKFRFLNPTLDFQKMIEEYYKYHSFIRPDFVSGKLDLSIAGDFTKIDADKRAEGFAKLSKDYWMSHDVPKPEDWTNGIELVHQAVKKIKSRNGQVIFIRMPTDDALWQIDEEYFPRRMYWDQFMSLLNTDSIHFKDVLGLDKFDLPDDSHLDQKDSVEFTNILFKHIKNKHLLN